MHSLTEIALVLRIIERIRSVAQCLHKNTGLDTLKQARRDADDVVSRIVKALVRLGYLYTSVGPDESIADYATFFLSALDGEVGYGRGVLALVHEATDRRSYAARLELLEHLFEYVPLAGNYDRNRLEADLAALDAEDNPDVHLFLGHLLYEQGDLDGAGVHFDQAVALGTDGETAFMLLARWLQAGVLWEQGRIEAALALVEDMERNLLPRLSPVELDRTHLPFRAMVMLVRGGLMAALGRTSDAITVLDATDITLKREMGRYDVKPDQLICM